MLLEFYFYFYTVSCQSHKHLDKGAADNERPLQVRSIYNDNVRVKTMKYKLVSYKMHRPPISTTGYGLMSQTDPKKCFIPQNCEVYINFD